MKRVLSILLTLAFVTAALAENEQGIPLKLLATLMGQDSERSTCVVLNTENQLQGDYRVMDKIGGYTIVRIDRGSVKLLKEGKLYALDFPLGNENKDNSNEALTIRRQAILEKIKDPFTMLWQGTPVPCVREGKIIGFRVPPLKDMELLRMAGLAEGDVATKVNGETLDSIPKAIEVYNKVKNQEKVNLEILRGDTAKTVTYFFQ